MCEEGCSRWRRRGRRVGVVLLVCTALSWLQWLCSVHRPSGRPLASSGVATAANISERQTQLLATFKEGRAKIDKVCLHILCVLAARARWLEWCAFTLYSFEPLLRAAVAYTGEQRLKNYVCRS